MARININANRKNCNAIAAIGGVAAASTFGGPSAAVGIVAAPVAWPAYIAAGACCACYFAYTKFQRKNR